LLRLAAPVVAAELGWMAMWLVDTMLVGRVGPEAIGAVSVGGSLFYTIAIFGVGLLLGLDYAVAHAYGAGRIREAQARPYFDATRWSLLPLLLFAALRRYLQGLGLVLPVTLTIVSANLVNAVGG
jgi:MATE family multidrug resistance protein